MIAEFDVSGVLLAPIVVYGLVAGIIFTILRWIFGRIGLLGWIWHPALFELGLYGMILSLLVLYC